MIKAKKTGEFWFYVAITTPVKLDDDNVRRRHVYIHGEADNKTILTFILITEMAQQLDKDYWFCKDREYHNIRGKPFKLLVDIIDTYIQGL